MKGEISNQLSSVTEDRYQLKIEGQIPLKNVFGGVWEISDTRGDKYVLKTDGIDDETGMEHLLAEVAFADYVKTNVPEVATIDFIRDSSGNAIQRLMIDGDERVFYLMRKAENIHKWNLSNEEQQRLGQLMAIFHQKMRNFDHPGLWQPNHYRTLSEKERQQLLTDFPTHNLTPFLSPAGIETISPYLTTIHGDWHAQNMSWTTPPTLFDLGMLSKSGRLEELSRTLSHWWFADSNEFKRFYDNLVAGYNDLTKQEISALPTYVMRDFYKSYCELISNAKDVETARKLAVQIDYARAALGLG